MNLSAAFSEAIFNVPEDHDPKNRYPDYCTPDMLNRYVSMSVVNSNRLCEELRELEGFYSTELRVNDVAEVAASQVLDLANDKLDDAKEKLTKIFSFWMKVLNVFTCNLLYGCFLKLKITFYKKIEEQRKAEVATAERETRREFDASIVGKAQAILSQIHEIMMEYKPKKGALKQQIGFV
jgi:hypothetical protein